MWGWELINLPATAEARLTLLSKTPWKVQRTKSAFQSARECVYAQAMHPMSKRVDSEVCGKVTSN